jgi:hypothetical protein
MKYLTVFAICLLSACSTPILTNIPLDIQEHLEAERDFHANLTWRDQVYETYDPEYISDCLYYQDLVCEFELE